MDDATRAPDSALASTLASTNGTSPDAAAVSASGVCVYNINRGEVTSVFNASMVHLAYYDATHNHNMRGFLARAGTSSPSIVRSAGCAHFLNETDGEWMLWIDSDVEFPPDSVDRMLEVAHRDTAPIICGLYVSTLPEGLVGLAWETRDECYDVHDLATRISNGERLIPVVKTGAGFLLIHRDVLLTMHKANPLDPWFAEEIIDGEKQGEDFTFCYRARRCGYPIFVDLGVDLQHHKTIALHKGMLGNVFVESREAGAVAPVQVKELIPT